MRPTLILAALAGVSALATPAAAHRMWLLPSTTVLSGTDEWVSVDAAVSNDLFYPDHFPMRTEQVTVWAPDGTTPPIEHAATARYRSIFDVRIDKTGTWKIGTEMSGANGSFKVNGVEWRVGGRRGPPAPGGTASAAAATGTPRSATGGTPGQGSMVARPSVATIADIPANATDLKVTETQSRNYVFVTAGAPTVSVFAPSGKGLEMQPVTHPDELVANEDGQFRFLIDGKPAGGVKVMVVPGSKRFRAAEEAQELTTSGDGLVRVKWPVAGVYWISASASDQHPSIARATDRRMSYTMTVEVPAP